MEKAMYFESLTNGAVRCHLCSHHCWINEGKSGLCKVRVNEDGVLYSRNYGRISGLQLDPIEKKPLYHFYPGNQVYSVGSVGCNFHCDFCQNCDISQWSGTNYETLHFVSSEELVQRAMEIPGNIGLAFTYNEPTVYFEYMRDVARISKRHGLKNIMVSNGFFSADLVPELMNLMDAFNIDLKGFNDGFYRKITHSALSPVLDNLVKIRKSGRHLEITNLIIPGLNDDPDEFSNMLQWMIDNLGDSTIFHISRYFPRHNRRTPATSVDKIKQLYELAKTRLKFVYVGNLSENFGQDTVCPSCHKLLISRAGYLINPAGIDKKGCCSACGIHIAIV